MKLIYITCLLLTIQIAGYSSTLTPAVELTISECFSNPIGFYSNTPTFSWKIPASDSFKSQTAYEIVVGSDSATLTSNADLWNSGKIISNQSTFIKYSGVALNSMQKAYWAVKYWDQDNNFSTWSKTASFEIGLLNNSDWKGKWISLPESQVTETGSFGKLFRPQYLRTEFNLGDDVKNARLYITANGVFEASLNGNRVGNDVMAPGWTKYSKRVETITYDVSSQLNKGNNAIGVIIAEGWYAGRLIFLTNQKIASDLPRLLCQLEIELKDGTKKTIVSDSNWKVTQNGPIRRSEIYDGETYDANYELPDWNKSGYVATNWLSVQTKEISSYVLLSPKRHHSVKTQMTLPVKSMSKPTSTKVIFDLGQNMVGVPQLKVPMKKGAKLTIRFAEMLNADGTLYTDNYRSAKSIDYYTAKENATITWYPKFTFHGFRYVELSGYNQDSIPNKLWLKGLVQYSGFEMNGTLNTSHEKLNQLQSNITWGLRGNFFDIPTDCPQRDERAGWTGDAQVFAGTSVFNAKVYSFWASWLQTARDEQASSGGVPRIIPNTWNTISASGWSDFCTIIPWELYMKTGDKTVLQENYNMMKKWVGYYKTNSSNYSLTIDKTFGDWLQPYASQNGDTDRGLICNAYWAYSVNLTMKAAGVLGYKADSIALSNEHKQICNAFEKKYFNTSGKVIVGKETQTAYLMALSYNLLSDSLIPKANANLIEQIKKADNHLRTGFLGTPLLIPYLNQIGENDLAFDILFKETYPSWFYSINVGATTMWERWNSFSHDKGFGDASMNSFNHYAYGVIGQWLYEGMLGINALEAGYKKILFSPQPGGPLGHAKGEYQSPYGIIKAHWKFENSNFIYNISIPANCTAKVCLPIFNKTDSIVLMNGQKTAGKIVNNKLVIDNVLSGDYEFVYSNVKLKPFVSFEFPIGDMKINEGSKFGLAANTYDPEGELLDVALYLNDSLIRKITQAPFRWGSSSTHNISEFDSLPAGNHIVKVVATDQDSLTSEVSLNLMIISPKFKIPGRIETEHFSEMSGVQVEACEDIGKGYDIGSVDSGDWLKYKVEVDSIANYIIEYRVASNSNNISLTSEIDAVNFPGFVSEKTGGWQIWKTIRQNIQLSKGLHDLRIRATGSGWNINWINIKYGALPLVEFISPSNDSIVENGNSLKVKANAFDLDGTINKVGLYVDNVLIREDNIPPFEWGYGTDNADEFNALSATKHQFLLVAEDNEGNIDDAMINITINKGVGINTIYQNENFIDIYPNPIQDILHIDNLNNQTVESSVKIYDFTGKNILDLKTTSSSTKIDISKFTKGIYFVRINHEDGIQVVNKIIKL